MKSTLKNRLAQLRRDMAAAGVDHYLIPRTDAFQNEFVRPCDERLQYISGFTGSAGLAVIGQGSAALITDARYTEQARHECDTTVFTIIDSADTSVKDYIATLQGTTGFDPWLLTVKQAETWGATMKPLASHLIDRQWDDRPEAVTADVFDFPDSIAGSSADDKIKTLCETISLDHILITACDSVSWLLNKRSRTLAYSPALLSYAIIDVRQGTASLFDQNFDAAALKGQTIGFDPASTPAAIQIALDGAGVSYEVITDPCTHPKSIKTKTEQSAIKRAHIADGVAIVQFMHWLDTYDGVLTELDVVDQLNSFRQRHAAFENVSFPTIAGFGANGAIIHYRPTEATNKTLERGNFLLLDSGGQYGADDIWGTTDITRTIPIGEVSEAMRDHYTRVLMGHIDLAMAEFTPGLTGKDLDTFARAPLKAVNLNYAHGTGHGVGCYLNVHEDAANISPKGDKVMEAGMLVSNEPGYYQSGSHGIRIENLILCQDIQGTLSFETITLAPIETSCINFAIMTADQIAWLNAYHETVYTTLSPHLDEDSRAWLRTKCAL